MKRIWMVLLVAAFCYGIDDPTKKSTEKPAPAKSQTKGAVKTKTATKKPEAVTIPPGAKEVEPGFFRWVDPKGQAWNYHATPFGYMKSREEKAVVPEAVPTDWTVSEQGADVNFTRPSPFGVVKWTVKKSEMNQTESAVYKRNSELPGKN